jgi:hypothetical protein
LAPCWASRLAIAPDIGLRTRQSGIDRQIDYCGRIDDVGDVVAECGDNAHRQHKEGERHDRVDRAADNAVDPATAIASREPQQSANAEGQRDRGHRYAEIEARGDDDAGENVAAELVCAEPVHGGRTGQCLGSVAGERVKGCQRGAECGAQRQQKK